MIRQAVILAAGKGTRMATAMTGPKMRGIPKPLLDVKNEPMIGGKIRKLLENGLKVCVVINPVFEAVFRQKLKKYHIEYRYQPEPLGVADALYRAKDFVTDDLFLVMLGDDVVEYDIKDVSEAKEPIVFGFEVDDVGEYGKLVVNRDGDVEDIVKGEKSGKSLVDTGIFVMPKAFFEYYDEIGANEKGERRLEYALKVLSRHGIKFKLKRVRKWLGVNTPEELLKANLET